MLQKLNERLQGLVSWVIIGLVAITFTLFGIESYMQSRQTSSDIVLEVNGSPITKEMVSVRLERARRALESTPDFNEKTYRHTIIEGLVNNLVGLQAARQSGFYVSPSQVDQAILGLTEFSEKGHFSPTRYQQVLAAALYSHEEFKHELLADMLIQQQRFAYLATDFTLPNELLSYVKDTYQSRRYRYLQIPADLFLKEQQVSAKDAKSYYRDHPFTAPEAVSLAYIRLSMTDIKSKLTIAPDELQQYYDENKANFSQEGKIKSFDTVKNEIQEQLKVEKAQVEYARLLEILSDVSYQTSDELETTAKTLGLKVQETELFTREGGQSVLTKNPQVIHAAFSHELLVSADNSTPLQLDPETVVVFRVLAHEPAKPMPFEQVKPQIDKILALEQSNQAVQRLGTALWHATDEERTQLMAEHQLSWHNQSLTTREPVDQVSAIHQLAFSVKQSGEYTGDFLNLPDGKQVYVLLQCEEILDGALSALTPEKQATLIKQLSFQQGSHAYEAYLINRKSTSTIAKSSN